MKWLMDRGNPLKCHHIWRRKQRQTNMLNACRPCRARIARTLRETTPVVLRGTWRA